MRSQIIKDILKENADIENILMRLKVIVYELKDEEIQNWIDKELNGYDEKEEVPKYRKIIGEPKITFRVRNHIVRNMTLPLAQFNLEEQKILCEYDFRKQIGLVKNYAKGTQAMNIPDVYWPYILKALNPYSEILDSKTYYYNDSFIKIEKELKNMLLDIFLKLEAEFGNLDSMDIFDCADSGKKREAIKMIKNFINITNSTITSSNLGIELNKE